MIKILHILCALIILTFVLVNNSHATVYFQDDFSSDINYNWEFGPGNVSDSWSIENGRLFGSVRTNGWSKLYAKWNNSLDLSDYRLEADVENVSGVDQIFHIRISDDKTKYYQIDYRYDEPAYTVDSNNITLYKFGDEIALVGIYPSINVPRKFNIEQKRVNKIKIEAAGNNIKVYFNDELVIDYYDESLSPLLTGGIGLLNWGGSCPVDVNNYFDNILVSSIDDYQFTPTPTKTVSTPTLTPTPTLIPTPTLTPVPTFTTTPVPTGKKIIVIPGLGASWNTEAMVYNKSVPDNAWKMTPYVNNYKRLINSLKENGLIENQDFFVWNYDWRRPVSEIVAKLNLFIDQNIKSNEKVFLVGHSLGGLTARIWAQNHQTDQRLGKVITLGSPHLGAVDTYEIWNGAKINSADITGIALNILLALQNNKKLTKVDTIRDYSPVIKDLLPVFDFVKKCNKTVKYTDLTFVNNYLNNQNRLYVDSIDNYQYMYGKGEKTNEWIELENGNYFDKLLNIWPDGKISQYISGDGDNTVLNKSARLGNNTFDLASNHGDIVDKATPNIISSLGLNEYSDEISDNDLQGKLVFFIGSPAHLEVKCDNNPTMQSNDQGFLLVDNQNLSKCIVKIVGTDTGIYHLVTGKSGNQDSYRYFEDIIGIGQTKTIIINGYDGVPFEGENNNYLCGLIERDTKEMLKKYSNDRDLMNIVSAAKKCNINKILEEVVSFRFSKKETVFTDSVIGKIRDMLVGNNRNINIKMLDMLWRKTVGTNNFKNFKFISKSSYSPMLAKFIALNQQKVNELIEEGNRALLDKNYKIVMANLEIINKLNLQQGRLYH